MRKFYSLAPRQLPTLNLIVNDLSNSRPEAIAQHLGVSASTVRRWLKAGEAPRSALLALFWETRWGLSALDAQAVNLVRSHVGLNKSLVRENETLRRRIERLEALSYGAANSPSFASTHNEWQQPFMHKG